MSNKSSAAPITPATIDKLRVLHEAEYLRERLSPVPGDPMYLHLSDLREALELFRNRSPCAILDFGCGGSPYRTLFQGAPYHRADYPAVPEIDFAIGDDSKIDAASSAYDLILSTQVLEHVLRPSSYLAECERMLKPGGKLLLSTHGVFEDHGCPYDFQRWTADGLRRLVGESGFEVLSVRKLTSGPRAWAFLTRSMRDRLVTADRTAAGWGLRILQRMLRKHPAGIDRFCDRAFPPATRIHVVTDADPGPSIYIALLIEARKQPHHT